MIFLNLNVSSALFCEIFPDISFWDFWWHMLPFFVEIDHIFSVNWGFSSFRIGISSFEFLTQNRQFWTILNFVECFSWIKMVFQETFFFCESSTWNIFFCEFGINFCSIIFNTTLNYHFQELNCSLCKYSFCFTPC